MSGFEVAGIVLGAIPLVISALEHYSDGVCLTQEFDAVKLTKADSSDEEYEELRHRIRRL